MAGRPKSVRIEVDGEELGGPVPPPPGPPGSVEVPEAGPSVQPIFADYADSSAVSCLRIRRTFPKDPPLGGMIGELSSDATEEDIRQRAGGGTYEVLAVGRTGKPLGVRVVRIAGQARIPSDPSGEPARASGEHAMFERLLAIQAQAHKDAAEERNRARDDREKQFQDFFLLVKEENKAAMAIVTNALTKSTEATVNAVTTMATSVLEVAKAAATAKPTSSGISELAGMADLVHKLGGGGDRKAGGSLPEIGAMLLSMYYPPPGTPQWYASQGKPPPAGLLPGSAPAPGAAATSPATSSPPPAEEEEPDLVAVFLEYIAQTPEELLAHVLAARLRQGTVPPRVLEVLRALEGGDPAPAQALLVEYDSADLAPRLLAAVQAIAQAQAASRKPA